VHYQPAASAIGQWSTNSNALDLCPLACRNFAYLTANDEHRDSDGITEKRIIRSSSLRPGGKKTGRLEISSRPVGGAEGSRTLYLRIANAALSQMSYGPSICVQQHTYS
tara:strand:- start:5679 stop:6005 length:327 start_codon:yes stop_codon:yes gene_type:complete